ncbi:MAG: YdcF family protein, partial [Clostridia bacterium]|nr:YdcF family protein [Clostridia bacterium]
ESIIYPEDKSTTTLENMKFSKAIADEHKENANILFSTTNYHVFRSGILSAKAGLRADGIGAKTKWYFWPNAQMREFIGLMAAEWKTNIVFILLMAAVPTALACIPAIAEFVIKHFG